MTVALPLCLSSRVAGRTSRGAAAEPDPPVGSPVLPDLMPKPQNNVLTQKVGNRWRIRFNTIIVNVGEGDFFLRAIRERPRAVGRRSRTSRTRRQGARRVQIRAPLVWGGDGHNHWHINRVAVVRLVPLTENGRVEAGGEGTGRRKGRVLLLRPHARAAERACRAHDTRRRAAGRRTATVVGMGLSPGWNDTYRMRLRGQWIDVTDVPAGKYRLFTEVDPQGWFQEASTRNNRTWIDIELKRTRSRARGADDREGPSPPARGASRP